MNERLRAGQTRELAPGVCRLIAPNAGLMTGPGTNTYLLGDRERAVIDPGPAIVEHVDAIIRAGGGAIRWVLVTHTHTDHSPAAAMLARATGAELIGRPAPAGQHQDPSFRPDRVPADGHVFSTAEFSLDIIHTPGHASNHLCYRHSQLKWLFTGDHIINGSTVVIDPPDGNMADYLQSLRRLQEFDLDAIAPGHGDLIQEPYDAIDRLIDHRLGRDAKVLAAVRSCPGLTSTELVPHVYDDVDASLFGVAERSLLAHLEKLERESLVTRRDNRWHPATAPQDRA